METNHSLLGERIEVPAFHLVLRLVSHIAARHFVGSPLCNDEQWLSTALEYTENAFRTIILIRIFPDILKPFVGWFIPYAYKVSGALRKAQKLVIPIIIARREEQERAAKTNIYYETPNDFLQWMMDGANKVEGQPEKLAHRLLVLTLAGVHTTSMAATQTLFDLCAHPNYIDPIREEILAGVGIDGSFQKTSLTSFRKLDSFMRESQRLNPPSLLGFKRAAREPITLSDGTILPKDVHIMMPVASIVTDADYVGVDALVFNGFRHFEKRLEHGEQSKHQFATTSSDNLHFGHGKFSCPGRFFASNSIK